MRRLAATFQLGLILVEPAADRGRPAGCGLDFPVPRDGASEEVERGKPPGRVSSRQRMTVSPERCTAIEDSGERDSRRPRGRDARDCDPEPPLSAARRRLADVVFESLA